MMLSLVVHGMFWGMLAAAVSFAAGYGLVATVISYGVVASLAILGYAKYYTLRMDAGGR